MAARVRWPGTVNLLLVVLLAALAWSADGAERGPALGRGINILGYDGIWEGYQNAPFRLKNLSAIRKAGFSHVRINFFG